jgi:hypothetical protein
VYSTVAERVNPPAVNIQFREVHGGSVPSRP